MKYCNLPEKKINNNSKNAIYHTNMSISNIMQVRVMNKLNKSTPKKIILSVQQYNMYQHTRHVTYGAAYCVLV